MNRRVDLHPLPTPPTSRPPPRPPRHGPHLLHLLAEVLDAHHANVELDLDALFSLHAQLSAQLERLELRVTGAPPAAPAPSRPALRLVSPPPTATLDTPSLLRLLASRLETNAAELERALTDALTVTGALATRVEQLELHLNPPPLAAD
jgi:hypothetical protein